MKSGELVELEDALHERNGDTQDQVDQEDQQQPAEASGQGMNDGGLFGGEVHGRHDPAGYPVCVRVEDLFGNECQKPRKSQPFLFTVCTSSYQISEISSHVHITIRLKVKVKWFDIFRSTDQLRFGKNLNIPYSLYNLFANSKLLLYSLTHHIRS